MRVYQLAYELTTDGKAIKEIEIDSTLSENHKYQTETTEHEVEDGLDITDNVRRLPIELTISGVITNTPSFLGSNRILTAILEKPSQNAFDFFTEIYKKGYKCNVFTSVNSYVGLSLIDFNYRKSLEESGGLHFDLTFREIIFAQAAEGKVDDVSTQDKSSTSRVKSKGEIPSVDATPEQTSKSSTFYDLVERLAQ